MDIFTKVKKVIVDQLDVEEAEVTLTAHLKDDLNADSLDMVELAMALEDAIGQQIDDQEIKGLETVGDIVKFVEGKMSEEEVKRNPK